LQTRFWSIVTLLTGIACAVIAAERVPPASGPERRTAVMVELFTSEGCSSCPPADLLLEKLDQSQPVPGATIIALSEHVDYWNHIGWTDPYSSPVFSSRQAGYARRFHLEGSYTPQMIVDGATELVGSDWSRAESTIASATKLEKVPIRLLPVRGAVRVEVDTIPSFAGRGKADVYFVLAQDSGTSDVLRGENQGRHLHHVAIVTNIQHVGNVSAKMAFTKDVPTGGNGDLKGVRIIVFVQEPENGRVWGAAMLRPAH
jgi:hypothetical protein